MRLFTSILGIALPFGAVLYGQSGADILGGPAGWAGAGLLGLVLAWLLLKHLPEKDRQTNDLSIRNDQRLDNQRKEFTETLTGMMAAFKTESASEREACDKHFTTLSDTMQTAFKALSDQLQIRMDRERDWKERLERQSREKHKGEDGK